MRLWSISPSYLDRQGLLAVWREGLLAQKVLLQGKMTNCKECQGTGKFYDGFFVFMCKHCKGTGKAKTPYYNHPQLDRFKRLDSIGLIQVYLAYIYLEAKRRDYNFDINKLSHSALYFTIQNNYFMKIKVTTGQLFYEFKYLQKKLALRNIVKYRDNYKLIFQKMKNTLPIKECIKPHPIFEIIEGNIESWEKIKKEV